LLETATDFRPACHEVSEEARKRLRVARHR